MTDQSHPDLDRLAGPDTRRLGLGAIAVTLGVLAVIGMLALHQTPDPSTDLDALGVTDQVYRAEVTEMAIGTCSYSTDLQCTRVTFRLLEGPTPGTIAVQEFEELASTPNFEVGERVMLNYLPDAPAVLQYQFADKDRRAVLSWVALVFAVAVVGLGRIRGLAALGGLVASVAVLLVFIVPSILAGSSPVLVAASGGAVIAFLALYLAHGWRPLTHVAVIGTFAALVLTAVLSALVVDLARFSGFAGEESFYLTLVGNLDVRGLLLAGIVLGAVGALDDVTVTQASAVWELRRANPGLSHTDLYSAGLRVGRDHIASTVNTLLLAYAGAAMPLLLLFALSGQPLSVVANSEVVAIEVVRTLVGSIGLVTAVPITSWLAAQTASARPPRGAHGGH